jgi:hypothetical protein
MSWIFGYFGNVSNRKINTPETPHYSFKDSNLILFVGGNRQTSFLRSNQPNSCWAVTGVGLESSENGYNVLSENDWNTQLESNQINLESINGHFVVLEYSNNELKFNTDELGLREIYITKLLDGFGFTTRIDWLKYFINPEIDLKEFGSRWLLQNQISRNSIIKNVHRLVCGNAVIKNDKLKVDNHFWQPALHPVGNTEMFDTTLSKLLSNDERKITLSLSGGLDSRLLLSYLANKDIELWESHTFGDPNHPDSEIASKLLNSLNRENEIIDDELPSTDKLVELVKTYSVKSIVTNPVSSILNLRFYDRLSKQNNLIIDGGFGEIWRREFANKLLLLGSKALHQKDFLKIFEFLKHGKADIFSEDIIREMKKGTMEQIKILFEVMPDVAKIGIGNWVDLFSIRARLPNYYAPEQARVDQYIISFMPLVQKDILKFLFGFNSTEKRNGRLFKGLIKQNAFQLTKHPLVKGNIVHPFNSSSLSARLHSRVKNRLGMNYRSRQQIELLDSLKEFIKDLIRSSEVTNYDLYDQRKLKRIADDFSAMESGYNSEIDWFLSFELFRQGISK